MLPPAQLRPATGADAAAIAAVYRPYVEGSTVSFEQVAPDAGEIARRMAAEPRLPWLVAERDGTVVGYCYGSRHRARAAYRWSVECSVYLAPSETGRGTGRALYEALLPTLADLGYVTALAGIALPNDASVRLHERVGFRPLGVFRRVGFKAGAWHDVGWWERALQDPPRDPAEPRRWEPPLSDAGGA